MLDPEGVARVHGVCPANNHCLLLGRAKDKPELTSMMMQNEDSDSARKAREAEQLRAAEKFMVVGTGEAECTSCGFIYDPRKGDPEYPVGPGTQFSVSKPLHASLLVIWQGKHL